MIRSICGGLALAVCSLSVSSGAPRQQDDQSAMPMRFVVHQQSAADGCGSHCGLLITASGMITADTPRDFDDFLHDRDIRGATIALDSKGGSLLGAIALGREIRGLGLATTIGRVRAQAAREGTSRRVRVSPNAECQSMCPFVLLGGVNRYVPPEARVLVHQIWLGDRRDDAVAASYSAEDVMLVQHDIGELMQYTMEMGGGAELLEMALRVPPWEPMRMLSRDEVRRTRLDTSQDRAGQAPTVPASPGASEPTAAYSASEGARRAFAGTQGWRMAPREGGSALMRRHPLTIQGEQVGVFEVALACGQTSGAYQVTYDETRRSVDEHDAAPLKQVDLAFEGKVATLDIVSSGASATPHTLETRANGTLSADLVKSFADLPGDSMTVRTVSLNSPETRTRIGNAGFASAFRKLAATCARVPIATHAELNRPTPRARSHPNNAAAGSLLLAPSHHLENGSAGHQ